MTHSGRDATGDNATPDRSRRRRLLLLIAVTALGALGGTLALQIAGTVGGDAGPGVVKLGVRLDNASRTELLFPPFGSVSARTHDAPLTVTAQVDRVDVSEVEKLVGDPRAKARLRAQIESAML